MAFTGKGKTWMSIRYHMVVIVVVVRWGVFTQIKKSMVWQLLVKYSEKVGAAFHRQLRLPLRVGVKGGLRVCSLKVRQ